MVRHVRPRQEGGLVRVAVEIVAEEARLGSVYQRLLRGVLPRTLGRIDRRAGISFDSDAGCVG